jgi:GT2 family glycosyltransferase
VGLSGPYVYYDLSGMMNFFIRLQYYGAYCIYLLHNYILRINSMATFGNLIIRRDALQKLGGYDLSVEFYGDDTDIALRLFQLGKVKFSLNLEMYSSGRRLQSEGIMRAEAKYIINYLWITYKKRPFTKSYSDIRMSNAHK